VTYIRISADSKWVIATFKDYTAKIWDLSTGKFHDFLKNEKDIRAIYFENASRWLIEVKRDNSYKVWDIYSDTIPDYLNGEKVNDNIYISDNSKWLVTISKNKITVREIGKGTIVEKIWLTRWPSDVKILSERWLYIVVGKKVLKRNLQTQIGNYFYYSKEDVPMNYGFEDIQEWIRLFGKQYMRPLTTEIKETYKIK
jgi:WD40 repeat protein